jgi:hypothetical protein
LVGLASAKFKLSLLLVSMDAETETCIFYLLKHYTGANILLMLVLCCYVLLKLVCLHYTAKITSICYRARDSSYRYRVATASAVTHTAILYTSSTADQAVNAVLVQLLVGGRG